MDTHRAAIIGCGRIASTIEDELRDWPGLQALPYSHAGAYRAARGVELVAAAEPDEKKLAEFGQRWGVSELFSNADEMLESVRPDLVSICVPTRRHARYVEAACANGVRGLLLEKPVAETLVEADQMVGEVERSGVVVGVNHVRSYDPFFERAQKLVQEGFIGDVHAVFACWSEGWSFGGSHLFDVLRMFVGSQAARVDIASHRAMRDATQVATRCDLRVNGIRAFITAPRETKTPREVDIQGTAGRLRIGDYHLHLFKNQTYGEIAVPTEWPFFARMEMRSGMTTLVEEVIRAMDNGTPVRSGIVEGRQHLELAVALNESARLGAPVDLPLKGANTSFMENGDLLWVRAEPRERSSVCEVERRGRAHSGHRRNPS